MYLGPSDRRFEVDVVIEFPNDTQKFYGALCPLADIASSSERYEILDYSSYKMRTKAYCNALF